MKIPSKEIPQADVLDDVVRVTLAISKGIKTYQEIAQYLGKVERQGAYYRLAAQILGLITYEDNDAVLEQRGIALLATTGEARESRLRAIVLSTPLFQRVLFFFHKHSAGITKVQLEAFLSEITEEAGPSIMPRRVQTVLSWLERVGLINESNDRYKLIPNAISKIPNLEYRNVIEPLFPQSLSLQDYQVIERRVKQAEKVISLMIDEAKLERANAAHTHLVNSVAERIRQAGYLPRYNQLIDLATEIGIQPYIFEMKSLQDSNKRAQVRRGLSQLYEYRYIQNTSTARLVLVIESQLSAAMAWAIEYLETDRQIQLIWMDGNELQASATTKSQLSFLWPGKH